MTKEAKLVTGIIIAVVAVLGVGIFLMTRAPQNYTNPTATVDPKNKEEALSRETPNVRGKLDSKVTVIEFGDLQCPACASVNPTMDELFKNYGDRVKFVFKHNPLPQHKNALVGADAAEAAGDQGKFWEMLTALYAKQPEWESLQDPKPIFKKIASEVGLDASKFENALNGQIHRDRINQEKVDGNSIQNPGTPTFYVNGEQIFNGGVKELKEKIEAALK